MVWLFFNYGVRGILINLDYTFKLLITVLGGSMIILLHLHLSKVFIANDPLNYIKTECAYYEI